MRILHILTPSPVDSDIDSADSDTDSYGCLPIFATYKYDFVPALIRLLDLAFKEWGWPGSALRAQSR